MDWENRSPYAVLAQRNSVLSAGLTREDIYGAPPPPVARRQSGNGRDLDFGSLGGSGRPPPRAGEDFRDFGASGRPPPRAGARTLNGGAHHSTNTRSSSNRLAKELRQSSRGVSGPGEERSGVVPVEHREVRERRVPSPIEKSRTKDRSVPPESRDRETSMPPEDGRHSRKPSASRSRNSTSATAVTDHALATAAAAAALAAAAAEVARQAAGSHEALLDSEAGRAFLEAEASPLLEGLHHDPLSPSASTRKPSRSGREHREHREHSRHGSRGHSRHGSRGHSRNHSRHPSLNSNAGERVYAAPESHSTQESSLSPRYGRKAMGTGQPMGTGLVGTGLVGTGLVGVGGGAAPPPKAGGDQAGLGKLHQSESQGLSLSPRFGRQTSVPPQARQALDSSTSTMGRSRSAGTYSNGTSSRARDLLRVPGSGPPPMADVIQQGPYDVGVHGPSEPMGSVLLAGLSWSGGQGSASTLETPLRSGNLEAPPLRSGSSVDGSRVGTPLGTPPNATAPASLEILPPGVASTALELVPDDGTLLMQDPAREPEPEAPGTGGRGPGGKPLMPPMTTEPAVDLLLDEPEHEDAAGGRVLTSRPQSMGGGEPAGEDSAADMFPLGTIVEVRQTPHQDSATETGTIVLVDHMRGEYKFKTLDGRTKKVTSEQVRSLTPMQLGGLGSGGLC